MFEVTESLSWNVRKKRAKFRISIKRASKEIGITRQTLRLIESGQKKTISRTVFIKLTNWLLLENDEIFDEVR